MTLPRRSRIRRVLKWTGAGMCVLYGATYFPHQLPYAPLLLGLVLATARVRSFSDSKLPASAISRRRNHLHDALGKLDEFLRTARAFVEHRERLGVTLEIGPGCRLQHRDRTGEIFQRIRSLLGNTQT